MAHKWAVFSGKGQIVYMLGFVGLAISVTTSAHLCHCRAKATVGNMEVNDHGCLLVKLYLWILEFKVHIIITS